MKMNGGMNGGMCRAFLVIDLAVFSSHLFVSALLTVKPSETFAVFGHATTLLQCRTSLLAPVEWWWTPYGTSESKPIYQHGTLVKDYDGHMVVKRLHETENLRICNITFNDAGKYTCYDDGKFHAEVDNGSAEVVVIDRNLICSHNMSKEGILGGDLCGLGSDIIDMTCSIHFSGNVKPMLVWTHDSIAHVSLDVNNFTLQNDLRQVSTMTVQARDDMNGSRFTCSVFQKRLRSTTTTKLKSWQSEKLNVLYISEKIQESDDVICPPTLTTCSVSASSSILETCEHKWSQSSSRMVSESAVLNVTDFVNWRDVFQCTVTCLVRGKTCLIYPRTVDSTECPDVEERCSSPPTESIIENTIHTSCTVYTVLLVVAIFIIAFLLCIVARFWIRDLCREKRPILDLMLRSNSLLRPASN